MSWIKLCWISLLLPATAVAAEERYTLVESKSFLYVEVKPAGGLLSKASHPHVVRATKWTGTVRWDPEAPTNCGVEIDIPVSGLVVDEPVMRKRLRYTKRITDGDRRRVRDNMRAEDQLAAEKFGTIKFVSTACAATPDGVEVTGDLEIRGKKKRVKVPIKLQRAGDTIRARGRFVLSHRDFGFEPYSTGFGAISNDQALTFHIRVVGTK